MADFPVLTPSSTILFYDTETEGLPLWDQPSEAPGQPKILQLAALLTDWQGNKLSSMDALLRWDTLNIHEDAFKAHGISAEKSRDFGIDPDQAISMFMAMYDRSTLRVGHNESFDARLIRIHLKQCHDHRWDEADLEEWKIGSSACTQRLTLPILQLPPTERMKQTRFKNSFKSPNLGEAYRWATGKEIKGAHNAMVDVLACKAVFFAVQAHMAARAPDVPEDAITAPSAPENAPAADVAAAPARDFGW